MANIDFSKLITSDQKVSMVRGDVLAQLADLRWQRETGGIALANGKMTSTSRESQMQIINLVQSLEAGLLQAPVVWKFQDGWVKLTQKQAQQVAKAVNEHVRRCFAAEKTVSDLAISAKEPGRIDLVKSFELAYQGVQ